MSYRYQLTSKNEHGDNGWYKKVGDEIVHYFTWKMPLCGTPKFHARKVGLQFKTAYDRRCKRCNTIRRVHLKARMNSHAMNLLIAKSGLLQPKSHSPSKPQ